MIILKIIQIVIILVTIYMAIRLLTGKIKNTKLIKILLILSITYLTAGIILFFI